MALCKICNQETDVPFAICDECQIKHPPEIYSGKRLSDMLKDLNAKPPSKKQLFPQKLTENGAEWSAHEHELNEKEQFEKMFREDMWDYERNREYYQEHKVKDQKEKLKQLQKAEREKLKVARREKTDEALSIGCLLYLTVFVVAVIIAIIGRFI